MACIGLGRFGLLLSFLDCHWIGLIDLLDCLGCFACSRKRKSQMPNGRPRKRATATTARLAPRCKGFEKSRFGGAAARITRVFTPPPQGTLGLCARMTRTSREVVTIVYRCSRDASRAALGSFCRAARKSRSGGDLPRHAQSREMVAILLRQAPS